jgi:Na+-translocating ferredoxin:NAD+ oxidoreductase RnfG subunit
MKYLLFITVIFLNILLIFSKNEISGDYKKKINKNLNSVWFGKTLEINEIILPDTLKNNAGFTINSVSNKDSLLGYYVVRNAFGCHVGGCDRPVDSTLLISEYEIFIFMTILSPEMEILKVDVLDYEATKGFQITAKKWLQQFQGKSDCNYIYGENIDAISGATTSAKSLIKNLNGICSEMKKYKSYGLL